MCGLLVYKQNIVARCYEEFIELFLELTKVLGVFKGDVNVKISVTSLFVYLSIVKAESFICHITPRCPVPWPTNTPEPWCHA